MTWKKRKLDKPYSLTTGKTYCFDPVNGELWEVFLPTNDDGSPSSPEEIKESWLEEQWMNDQDVEF